MGKMNFLVFFGVVFLALLKIKLTVQGNITLLTLTMEDGPMEEPVANVVIKMIEESDPQLFQNFSRVVLKYRNSTLVRHGPGGPRGPEGMIGQPPPLPSCDVDNVANFFFNHYFHHPNLFTRPLSEQFTIITSDGEIVFEVDLVRKSVKRYCSVFQIVALLSWKSPSFYQVFIFLPLSYPKIILIFSLTNNFDIEF
jgi:hypothetical protein